jgi:hypothetical protein
MWIAADPFNGRIRVLITGPQGFERTVTFAIEDVPLSDRRSACGRPRKGSGAFRQVAPRADECEGSCAGVLVDVFAATCRATSPPVSQCPNYRD